MPSQAAVAATGKPSLYRQHGKLIGREARAFGFNVVLAPVLDLALPESQPVMRTRTGFRRPGRGHSLRRRLPDRARKEAHVSAAASTFPASAEARSTPTTPLPSSNANNGTALEADLLPYRNLKSRLPMVMISHASYPAAATTSPHQSRATGSPTFSRSELAIAD
jgi:beta-N-acetylhexosaminidase